MENNSEPEDPLIPSSDDEEEEVEDNDHVSLVMERYRSNKMTDLKFALCFEIVGVLFFTLSCVLRYDKKCQK